MWQQVRGCRQRRLEEYFKNITTSVLTVGHHLVASPPVPSSKRNILPHLIYLHLDSGQSLPLPSAGDSEEV